MVTAWEYRAACGRIQWGQTGARFRARTPGRKQYYLLRSKAEIYLRQNIAETNLFWTMLEQFRMNQRPWKEGVSSE